MHSVFCIANGVFQDGTAYSRRTTMYIPVFFYKTSGVFQDGMAGLRMPQPTLKKNSYSVLWLCCLSSFSHSLSVQSTIESATNNSSFSGG